MKILLSILVPSTHTRYNTFRPNIERQLYSQLDALPDDDKSKVEIIILTDNKRTMLGSKRNTLVEMSQGEYVCHVDDDDRLETDYISSLLEAIKSGADVITFQVSVTLNGGIAKIARYSKDYGHDYNTDTGYFRIPNHICCIKKSVSLNSSFPNIKYGEDAAFAKVLLPHIKTEHTINRVLYHYDWDENTTETQEHIVANRVNKPTAIAPIVDVVILSSTKNNQLYQMCKNTIDTCIKGANGLSVNVIVIEQQPGVTYGNARTVYHSEPFNYNAFANLGARYGNAQWIMIANNDLIFKDGWLHDLLAANHPIVSPHEPRDGRQQDMGINETGYTNGRHLSGWCYMIKRSLWEEIGCFDDEFSGWYADDSLIEQLRAMGIPPMLVTRSLVEHLGSITLSALPTNERDYLCWSKLERFNEKYGQNKFVDNPNYINWRTKNAHTV